MLLVDLYGTAGAGAASGPAGWASKTRVQKVRSGSSGRGYRWNISGIRVSFKKLVARNQVSEETRVRRTGGARGRACTWVGTSNQLPPNMAAKPCRHLLRVQAPLPPPPPVSSSSSALPLLPLPLSVLWLQRAAAPVSHWPPVVRAQLLGGRVTHTQWMSITSVAG